jgi:hypothetical protein
MFELPLRAAGIRRSVQRVLRIEIVRAAASHSTLCQPRAGKLGGYPPLKIRRRRSNLVHPKTPPVTGGVGPVFGGELEVYPLVQESSRFALQHPCKALSGRPGLLQGNASRVLSPSLAHASGVVQVHPWQGL